VGFDVLQMAVVNALASWQRAAKAYNDIIKK
jgi:hypothetical protein